MKNIPFFSPISRLTIVLLLLPLAFLSAQRETKTINDSWRFLKGDAPDVASVQYNDSKWEAISIPHTWNTDAYTEKDYYRGIGWYRRSISLPQSWKDKTIYLKFEGANKAASVYVNGQLVGEHSGGYTAFTFDITSYCAFSSSNTIAVRVDNSRMDIPPISGDFTFFGGIYRDVWITAVSKQHVSMLNNGSDGIFIQTPQVSETEASLVIKGEIKNDASNKVQVELEHVIFTPSGTAIQTLKQSILLKANELYSFNQIAKPIGNPDLWSPESPELYKVETTLRNAKTKEVLDRTNHYTGFRWYSFDAGKGFSLNGKSYKLRGVCRHQDQKPVGSALSDEMHRRDMRLMKEMGINFIRISHYPQDIAILEECDKLGILAWEEIPIIDIVPDTEGYDKVCETNLREMIRQHYNHPSIILWGYMNEIMLVTQRRYTKKDELRSAIDRTLALASKLEKTLKEEDPYRISTIAFHGSNIYNEVGLGSITDVVGWNLYSGWYGGDLTGFESFLDNQYNKYSTHPIIVSEYGAGSDKRLHSLMPKSFDFSIEYQQKYLEHYLPVIEEKPYVSGAAHWNFIDFSSASRDESMPRINNKGLVYANRTPKDVFYYYKAMFRKDVPVLYIASRDWAHRAGIQTGTNPVIFPIKVYTNLPEVELFINGASLGKKESKNCNVIFDVPFVSGDNLLRTVGSAGSKQVEDAITVRFTPIPENLNNNNLEGLELAINVGSNCFFTSDESNLTWIPDHPYVQGHWGYLPQKESSKEKIETSTKTQIQNTSDGPLYQTLYTGIDGYRFDVPQGEYEVELLFADVFKESGQSPYQLDKGGQTFESKGNAFHIYINGRLVEEAFCPGEESGYFRAVHKRYIVDVKEDKLEVNLKTINGKNFLNGIKIRKL
ncbi:Beta-galactosidase BoGH2A [termite gut metagenome]|uniref:Beta-galactosidase BoGH2A n=1 Tax=termite gut metagenome TaxID=433724 RepID=A0A5J4SYM0_9ZZZZ